MPAGTEKKKAEVVAGVQHTYATAQEAAAAAGHDPHAADDKQDDYEVPDDKNWNLTATIGDRLGAPQWCAIM